MQMEHIVQAGEQTISTKRLKIKELKKIGVRKDREVIGFLEENARI